MRFDPVQQLSTASPALIWRSTLSALAVAGAVSLLLLSGSGSTQVAVAADVGTNPPPTTPQVPADDTTIRPFRYHVPEEALVDLRRRIASTRWPEPETVTDASQGVQLATMQKLATYWGSDYDWRKCEAKLNALLMFVTRIDGLDIQFIHVRSKNRDTSAACSSFRWQRG